MEKLIHNIETGEIVIAELTPEELQENAKLEQEHQKELQLKAEAQAKRQMLLDKLGITEEEAKLLFS